MRGANEKHEMDVFLMRLEEFEINFQKSAVNMWPLSRVNRVKTYRADSRDSAHCYSVTSGDNN